MSADAWPCTVVSDRYNGAYSKGKWLAFPVNSYDVPDVIHNGDSDVMDFWDGCGEGKHWMNIVGRGDTPDTAVLDMVERSKK